MLTEMRKRAEMAAEDRTRLRRLLKRAERAEDDLGALLARLVDDGYAASAADELKVSRQALYQRVARFRDRTKGAD